MQLIISVLYVVHGVGLYVIGRNSDSHSFADV